MTRTSNARMAGFAFLFYIAVGITSMILSSRAIRGEGIVAKLASIAQHVTEMRVIVVLTLLASFSALALGTILYAITRDQDPDLAMLVLICRVVTGGFFTGPIGWLGWMPLLVFEVTLALWFLIKGVAEPAPRS